MPQINLEKAFSKWNELNKKAEGLLGNFNFVEIKKVRKEQKKLEDQIFNDVLSNAPDAIKKILPEDVGELEIGYDVNNKVFYFVMLDPSLEDDEQIRLIAITIDLNKNIEIIENFEIENE